MTKLADVEDDETLDEFMERWSVTVDDLKRDNPIHRAKLDRLVGKSGQFGRLKGFPNQISQLNVPDNAVARIVVDRPQPPVLKSYANPNLDWLTYETTFNTRFDDVRDFRKPNGAFKMGLYTVPLKKVDIWVVDRLNSRILVALSDALMSDIENPHDLRKLSAVTWDWKDPRQYEAKYRDEFLFVGTKAEVRGNRAENRVYLEPRVVFPYNYYDNDAGSHAMGSEELIDGIKQIKSEHFWWGWKTASRSTIVRPERVRPEGKTWVTFHKRAWEQWSFSDAHRTGAEPPESAVGAPPGAYSLASRQIGDVSLKTGVMYVGKMDQGGAHKDVIGDWLLGCLRSDYIAKLHDDGRFPKDDPLVLTELMTVVEKEVRQLGGGGQYREGIQIRDISRLDAAKVYFPPLAIPQVDLSLTASRAPFHLLYRDWDDSDLKKWRLFWKKCWAVPLGRAKALVLLRYGFQLINPNVQNFLIEFDPAFLRAIPPAFFDEGAPLRDDIRIVVRDLNDAALHRQITWAWNGGAGAPPPNPGDAAELSKLDNPLLRFEFEGMSRNPATAYQGGQETGSTDAKFGPVGLQFLWHRFSAFTNGDKFQEAWADLKDPLLAMLADWGVAHGKAYVATVEAELGLKFTNINWSDVADPGRYLTANPARNYKTEFEKDLNWEQREAGKIQAYFEDAGVHGGLAAIKAYRDRGWKPAGGNVAVVTVKNANTPVPWRPVTIRNPTTGTTWTDLTDEVGKIAVHGPEARGLTVPEILVHKGLGNRNHDPAPVVTVV